MKNELVRNYMSKRPRIARPDMTLAEAHTLMRTHRIHHLPVVDNGKLVGEVSIRDLYLLETLPDVDTRTVTLEDAMSPKPYTVPPDASLDRVVRAMLRRRLGSAIVVEKGAVTGVFTTTDALKALWRHLSKRPASSPREKRTSSGRQARKPVPPRAPARVRKPGIPEP